MAKLYPKIKPYKTGYLDVGGGHSLYYELCGNPKGKPVLFLHGGPGAGCRESDRQFFNPKKFNAILFDQRGAGRSKPFASLKNNTTQNLAGDVKKLLKHLKIDKVFLFGGSWGSTLALAYATKHPKTVAGMLLRGIFLASSEDISYFLEKSAKEMCPEARERLLSIVPKKHQKHVEAYYFRQMRSKNKKTKKTFAFEWTFYESRISRLKSDEKKIRKKLKKWNYKACALIESYYMAKKCFLKENQLLKNAHKLSGIPTTIVHGRYDLVCPPKAAYGLHKKIKQSKLIYTIAGHTASEKETQETLIKEMNRIGQKINW